MNFHQASAGHQPSVGSLELHKSTQSPKELNGDGLYARSGLHLENGKSEHDHFSLFEFQSLLM